MLIDIIMPCYYSNDIIRPCLESIKRQTIVNKLRVIMINDCSPHTSCKYQDLIQEYKQFFEILYLETEQNSGPGVARNLGIDVATADWIWFQDDDDEIYANDSLEALLNIIGNEKIENIICLSGHNMQFYDMDKSEQLIPQVGSTQGSLFNRKILQTQQIKFEPILSFKEEDTAFVTRVQCATRGKQYLVLTKPVYKKHWGLSHDSLTSHIPGLISIYNLLGAKAYSLSYYFEYNDLTTLLQRDDDITDFYIMIPTLIHNLVLYCQKYHLTITTEMYQQIEEYTANFLTLLKLIVMHHLDFNTNLEQLITTKSFLQDLFNNDSWFGPIDINVIQTFNINYIHDLDKLKQCIQDKNK